MASKTVPINYEPSEAVIDSVDDYGVNYELYDDNGDKQAEGIPGQKPVIDDEQEIDEQTDEASSEIESRIKELEEKLGLNETKEQPTDKQSSEEVSKESESKKDTTDFDTQFEKRFGVSAEQALDIVNQLIQFQQVVQQIGGIEFLAQQKIRSEEEQLRQEWGVSVEEAQARLDLIREYFRKLSPEKQAALDNLDGARLVWAYLERDHEKSNKVPQFQKSGKAKNPYNLSTKKRYSVSELLELPEDEYRRLDWGSLGDIDLDYGRI